MVSQATFLFCKSSLKKVSRTFYLNTVALRKPVMEHVMISYLLCRIADTVEDDPKLSDKEKSNGLKIFRDLLCTTTRDYNFTDWNNFYKSLNATNAETELCANIEKVFTLYSSFQIEIRNILIKRICILIDGMEKYTLGQSYDKLNQLKDFKDLDLYCYYVAGVVGELLTDVFCANSRYIGTKLKKKLDNTTVDFGLGLQYVNIIKDVYKDFERNWCYYPKDLFSKHHIELKDFFDKKDAETNNLVINEMIDRAFDKLDSGLKFVLLLPRMDFTLRIFCLWPLFFALNTLLKIDNNKFDLLSGQRIRITRRQVKMTMIVTSVFVFSNTLLNLYYKFLRKRST